MRVSKHEAPPLRDGRGLLRAREQPRQSFPPGGHPRGLRGTARRKTQTYGCPHPLPDTAGASRRANKRSSSEAVAHKKCANATNRAHAICNVLSASGPAFQWPSRCGLEAGAQRAQVARSAIAQRTLLSQLLAGTPSGPGGSSDAVRVSRCEETRRRRTPSRNHNASRERPFKWTRWRYDTAGFGGGDKVLGGGEKCSRTPVPDCDEGR